MLVGLMIVFAVVGRRRTCCGKSKSLFSLNIVGKIAECLLRDRCWSVPHETQESIRPKYARLLLSAGPAAGP
jgi:hypothetical protein